MPISAPARLAALRQEVTLLRHTIRELESSAPIHRRLLSEAQRVLQGLLFRPKPLQPHSALHQPSLPSSVSQTSCKKPKKG
ncbi:hypothetical protein CLOM_g11603 [Closterium sp. NIES-68]|nr:hypothetical protein CLOM_g11603 [Closterium sp. NIES-68]